MNTKQRLGAVVAAMMFTAAVQAGPLGGFGGQLGGGLGGGLSGGFGVLHGDTRGGAFSDATLQSDAADHAARAGARGARAARRDAAGAEQGASAAASRAGASATGAAGASLQSAQAMSAGTSTRAVDVAAMGEGEAQAGSVGVVRGLNAEGAARELSATSMPTPAAPDAMSGSAHRSPGAADTPKRPEKFGPTHPQDAAPAPVTRSDAGTSRADAHAAGSGSAQSASFSAHDEAGADASMTY